MSLSYECAYCGRSQTSNNYVWSTEDGSITTNPMHRLVVCSDCHMGNLFNQNDVNVSLQRFSKKTHEIKNIKYLPKGIKKIMLDMISCFNAQAANVVAMLFRVFVLHVAAEEGETKENLKNYETAIDFLIKNRFLNRHIEIAVRKFKKLGNKTNHNIDWYNSQTLSLEEAYEILNTTWTIANSIYNHKIPKEENNE